jgi:hypothetical protein
MNNRVTAIFFLSLCFLFAVVSVNAQATRPTLKQPEKMTADMPVSFPADPTTSSFLFGQNHRYSVLFRGNGEAVVTFIDTFANGAENAVNTVTLQTAKGVYDNLTAYQIISREPNPTNYWYSQSTYQKAQITRNGATITVTLPQAVKPQKTGSVILVYRLIGATTKNIVGTYEYAFETLKIDDTIADLQVGVTVDSDLVLRGTKSQLNYRWEDVSLAAKGVEMTAPVANTHMDMIVGQVGYGSLVKTARQLSPGDSYTVNGSYADSWWRLYAKEALIAAIVIIGLVVLKLILLKKLFGYVLSHTASRTQATPLAQNLTLSLATSFLSAFFMVLYTVCLFISQNYLNLTSDYRVMMGILLALVSIGIYSLLLLAPSLVMGVKRGVTWGIVTFAATVGWLIVDTIIIMGVFMLVGNRGYSDIMPMGTRVFTEVQKEMPPVIAPGANISPSQ